mgnify:CR=1 FL=1
MHEERGQGVEEGPVEDQCAHDAVGVGAVADDVFVVAVAAIAIPGF